MPDIIDLEQRKKEISNKQNRERISRDIKYSEMVDKIQLILGQCIDGLITIGEFKGIIENIYNTLPSFKGNHEEEFKEGSMYLSVPQRQKLLDKYAKSLAILTKLANDLDSRGLFEEANAIDELIKEAINSNPKVLQWQQNYNKKNNLKPGMPGYLQPDGLSGPATQNAVKKDKEMQLAQQVYTDPRKQHYDINQSTLTPPK